MTDKISDNANISGKFDVEIWRDGKQIDNFSTHNAITAEGKTHILKLLLDNSEAKKNTWYVGLQLANNTVDATWGAGDTNQFTATGDIVEDDGTIFVESGRQEYVDDAVEGTGSGPYSIDNDTTKATYTVDTGQSTTVYGAFLVSNSTYRNTTAPLLCVANFSAGKALSAGDEIKVKYTIQIS